MKKMKFNTLAGRTMAAGFVLGLFMAAQSAAACTLQNWSAAVGLDETDASQGTIAPGGPNPATPNEVLSPRFSGLCAMKTSGEGFVQDNSPGGINRIISRFYVLVDPNQFTGSSELYAGFSSIDGSGKLFSVTVDDNRNVQLTDIATNESIGTQSSTNWIAIEMDWIQGSGAGELNLTVNGVEKTSKGLDNAGTSLAAVRLGQLSSANASGALVFDAYESRRTTAVGIMLAGDANGSGTVNIADAGAIIAEIDGTLQSGQPDCNENGFVNLADVGCVIAAL